MKGRAAKKAKEKAERPSSDEEDAISVESVKVIGKKSARMFSHVKNSKLPLMELTKNDIPLEGDNLAQALLKTADALKQTRIVALEAELKARKKGKETCEGKASDSTYNPASFSAPSKDEHVKRIQKRYPSLVDNTEYQQILGKYGGFYKTCINCGKTDLKQLPCGCGKKGEESNDSKVRDMCEAFKKYRKFQVAASKKAR